MNKTKGNVTSYEGLCIHILEAIARQLNFTYVITPPADGMFGSPEANGTWNGMVGMVRRGEADLAIGPFTITSVRDTVVDFTVPYMEDGGGILTRKSSTRPELMRIFSPFTSFVWLATCGMVLVFGVVLFFITKYNPWNSEEDDCQGLGSSCKDLGTENPRKRVDLPKMESSYRHIDDAFYAVEYPWNSVDDSNSCMRGEDEEHAAENPWKSLDVSILSRKSGDGACASESSFSLKTGRPQSMCSDGSGSGAKVSDRWNIVTSIWTVFSSIMEQGAVHHPQSCSARVVLGCWWVFTVLLMAIYTATLAAMLTVIKQPQLINSIEDVHASQSIQPLTLAGTNWDTMFKTAKSGIYKDIGERMKKGPTVLTTDEALAHVLSGQAAFLYDISQVDYLYRQNCKNLHLAERVFSANGLGLVLPQQAPFRHAFNRIILKLQEGGFLSIWRRRWWQGNGVCVSGKSSSLSQSKQLNIASVAGIFIVYIAVVLLAVLAHLIQCFQKKVLSRCSAIRSV